MGALLGLKGSGQNSRYENMCSVGPN